MDSRTFGSWMPQQGFEGLTRAFDSGHVDIRQNDPRLSADIRPRNFLFGLVSLS